MSTFQTSDTYFASVLVALDKPLIDVEVVEDPDEGMIVQFLFDDPEDDIADIYKRYDLDTLLIRAKRLAMAIKEQKKRVATIMRGLGR